MNKFTKFCIKAVFAGTVLGVAFLSGKMYGVHHTDAQWLALNLYHEDRTDGILGRRAVAAVVFNRMADRYHYFGEKSVKGIVTSGAKRGANCDFSWTCDGKPDFNVKYGAWFLNYVLAYQILIERDLGIFTDPTHGATWYHVKTMEKPASWPDDLEVVGTVGLHTFYRYKKNTATALSP